MSFCVYFRIAIEQDVLILSQFVDKDGNVLSRDLTGVCAKQQLHLRECVERAMTAGNQSHCVPYVTNNIKYWYFLWMQPFPYLGWDQTSRKIIFITLSHIYVIIWDKEEPYSIHCLSTLCSTVQKNLSNAVEKSPLKNKVYLLLWLIMILISLCWLQFVPYCLWKMLRIAHVVRIFFLNPMAIGTKY